MLMIRRPPDSPRTDSRFPYPPSFRSAAHPLLERVRFLSISASNLDEFFMVRVVGLKTHQILGIEERSADGLKPGQQLAAIVVRSEEPTPDLQERRRISYAVFRLHKKKAVHHTN